jgi:hypothetical protein
MPSTVLEKKENRTPSNKPVAEVEHLYYLLTQGLLLVLFISLRRLILRLLYTIPLFIDARYSINLLRYSIVILGGAFSIYLLGKKRNRKLKAGAIEGLE